MKATDQIAVWRRPGCWLIVAGLCLTASALMNSLLGPPMIFSDEYSYLAAASQFFSQQRITIFGPAGQDLPNRLFFGLYALPANSATPFAAARLFNVVALGIGVTGLLLAAKRLGWPVAGIAIVVAYLLGDLATFSAYFMPDVLYGAAYILTCVGFAAALVSTAPAVALAVGAGLAILTFIKPHGFVIVAVFAVYSAAYVFRASAREKPKLFGVVIRTGAAFAITWLVLQLLLPDVAARSGLLGALYGSQASQLVSTATDPAIYVPVAKLMAIHLAIVTVVAGPALLFGVKATTSRGSTIADAREQFARVLSSLSVVTLAALIGLVSIFTVSVAMPGSFESTNRLHTRLYAFAIPLLILASAGSATAQEFWSRRLWIVIAVWMLACALCAVFLRQFTWYSDSPELFFGAHVPKAAFAFVGMLGVLGAIVFRRFRTAMGTAMLVAYVTSSIVSGSIVRKEQFATKERTEDRAGAIAAAMATQADATVLIVADTGDMNSLIGSFEIAAHAPSRARVLSPQALSSGAAHGDLAGVVVGREGDVGAVPIRSRVALGPFVIGLLDHTSETNDNLRVRSGARPEFEISFASPQDSKLVVTGLHAPEKWGAWTSDEAVIVRLPKAIAGRMVVKLRAIAMRQNAGQPLTLRFGDQSRQFVLAKHSTDVSFLVDLQQPADTISIAGYRQVSPAKAAGSRDPRMLGIGLVSMRVETTGAGN